MNKSQSTRSFARAAFTGLALFASSATALAQSYTTYDMVVPVTPTSVTTRVDGTGRILPTNRSYIIALEGGTRGPILLSNWTATDPNYPVIVVNQHGTGRVIITDQVDYIDEAIEINNCSFFAVRGDNDPAHYYGIKVARAGGSKRGVSIGNTSTNIEIAYLEITNSGFTGIMAKTDPVESRPETWAANYVMRDLHIHDNHIHDVGGEGMYLGYTSWSTDHWTTVPGYESHEIKGLKVHHNLIERTSWDGLQVASAPDDPSATDDDVAISDNIIFFPGTSADPNHSGGLFIGGGAGGKAFNNVVIGSTGTGITVMGSGYNTVYNNLVIGSGIFTDNRGSTDPRRTIPGSYESFYNNTIVTSTVPAFWTMNEVTVNAFKNNIALVSDTAVEHVREENGGTVTATNNLLLRNTTGANFVNPAEYDYRIVLPSSGANIGTSLASLPTGHVPVVDDFQGIARPQGAAYDAGYSEAGPISVHLVSTPPTTGNTGSVKASTIGGTSPYTYAWSNGATTQTITNVPEGLYRVTVTDAVGAKMSRATYIANGAGIGAPVRVPAANEVLAPTFSPAPGTFTTAQSVSLASATSGATIRYTTNGTSPTSTSGTIYSGPISVTNSTVITAIAYKSGLESSVLAKGTFVINNAPTNTKFTGLVAAESGHASTNVVGYTIDGNLVTRWAANTDGSWVSYDLGSNRRLGVIYISWYRGDVRHYTFDLQVSTDNTNWTNVLVGHQSPMNAGLQGYDIPDFDPVRYVRIVTHGYVQGTSVSASSSIEEVELWGGAAGGATAPVITTQPQSQTIALGANVTFTVTATGSPSPTYQWRKDGTPISGATSSAYTITNVQTSHAGNYSVVVTNSAGAVTSNNATLTVNTGSLGSPLQAEDATVVGALVRTNQTGYTGTGFVDYINASNDYIEWSINNPSAATRTLTFRYAMTGSPRTLSLSVNGVVVNAAFASTTTGGSNIWALTTTSATSPAGTVLVRLTATGTSGPNVDYLQVD